MQRTLAAAALALGIVGLGLSQGANAHEFGRHGFYGPRFSFGLNLGFPIYAEPYYPYYPSYPYYPAAPAVVYTTPPATVINVPASPPSQVVYQYYCATSNEYYPRVPTCTQPWLKVVPDGTATY